MPTAPSVPTPRSDMEVASPSSAGDDTGLGGTNQVRTVKDGIDRVTTVIDKFLSSNPTKDHFDSDLLLYQSLPAARSVHVTTKCECL